MTSMPAAREQARWAAIALLFSIFNCVPAAHGQGVSNVRDRYGNLVRDNGIAAQYAPRPMTNNSTPQTQPSNNARPPSIVLKRQ
jgi:hypothetical protein